MFFRAEKDISGLFRSFKETGVSFCREGTYSVPTQDFFLPTGNNFLPTADKIAPMGNAVCLPVVSVE